MLVLAWGSYLSGQFAPDAASLDRYGARGTWVGTKDRSNT